MTTTTEEIITTMATDTVTRAAFVVPMGQFAIVLTEVWVYSGVTMSLIALQDKLIAAELAAIAKHGKNTLTVRKVIFAARTRFIKAVIAMGFSHTEAGQFARDATDMVLLHLEAK
jgi:glutaminase